MHIPSSLRITAFTLGLGSIALAQTPPPPPPLAPSLSATASNATSTSSPASQLAVVTQSSRIRAFNVGQGGEVRSLYLQNGSVINVAPGLGGQVGQAVRKGEKVTVTGTKSEINGQSLVEASSIRLNDQTFSATPPSGFPLAPVVLAQGTVPPPPDAPQTPPPPSRRRDKARAPAPCRVSAEAPPPPPDFGVPPPPPADGMAPPPPPPQN